MNGEGAPQTQPSPSRRPNMTLPPTTKPWAYLKFYGSDFLNATASWTMEERGIYVTLLWYAWVNDGLPSDIDRLERMAAGCKAAWPLFETKFPIFPDGKRRNPRMEQDRDPFNERSKALSDRALRAANARWHPGDDASSNASSMLQASDKQCLTHHSQSQSQSQNKTNMAAPLYTPAETGEGTGTADNETDPPARKGGKGRPASGLTGANDPEALEVYEAYPRKVGRGAGVREIQRALDRLQAILESDRAKAATVLLAAVKDYARTVTGTEAKFIAHPRTWFSQGRWEDYVSKMQSGDQPKLKKSSGPIFAVEYLRQPTDSRAKPTLAEARFMDEEQARSFAERFGGKIRTL